jgi:hypothetical protein
MGSLGIPGILAERDYFVKTKGRGKKQGAPAGERLGIVRENGRTQ